MSESQLNAISLETVLAAQSAHKEKQAKKAQYDKELVSAQKRADRLTTEVAEAEKSYTEIRKAYEAKVTPK